MRAILKPLLPMAVAALVMVAPVGAHQVHAGKHLTKTQKVAYYKKLIWHDNQQVRHANTVFNFFENHNRLLANAQTKSTAWSEIKKWREIKRDHLVRLRFTKHRLSLLTPKPVIVPWLLDAFTCIHQYEGAWNANTGNGFYGGLQMDMAFQASYGAEFLARYGTADNWPIWAQLKAASRAYQSGRGFYPWPNTARACGLI